MRSSIIFIGVLCLKVSYLNAMDWVDPLEWARVLEAIHVSSTQEANRVSSNSSNSLSKKRTRTEAAREQGERDAFRSIRARLLEENVASITSNTTNSIAYEEAVQGSSSEQEEVDTIAEAIPGLPNEVAMNIYRFLDEPTRYAFRGSSLVASVLTARYVPLRLTLSDLTIDNLERNRVRYQEARYLMVEKTQTQESEEEDFDRDQEDAISDYQVYLLAEYFPGLMGLNLTNIGLTGQQLGIIAENFENLRSLNIENNCLVPADFENLRGAAFAERLEILIIGGNVLSSQVACMIKEVFTALKSLDISYYYRSLHERLLSEEPGFFKGEYLGELGPITRDIVTVLHTAPLAQTLEHIDLSQAGAAYPLVDDATDNDNALEDKCSVPSTLQLLGTFFPRLRAINLSENFLARQEVTQLAKLPIAQTVESLDFSDNDFGREFRAVLRALATQFNRLTRLNLTRPGINRSINVQDVQIFTAANAGARITSLSLEGTQIIPEAVRALPESFPNLQELDLSFNRTVTAELLEHLIDNLPNLRVLVARHITITDEQKEAVLEKFKAHKHLERVEL